MFVSPNVSCIIILDVIDCLLVAVYQHPKNLRGVSRGCVFIVVSMKLIVGVSFVLDIKIDLFGLTLMFAIW